MNDPLDELLFPVECRYPGCGAGPFANAIEVDEHISGEHLVEAVWTFAEDQMVPTAELRKEDNHERANQLGHKWEAEYWNRRGELRVCGVIAQAVREVLAEAPAPAQPIECIGNDPSCPCQDGDACHYKGENPMPVPAQPSTSDCVKCGCMRGNHISGRTEMKQKCMSCDNCDGYVAPAQPTTVVHVPIPEGNESRYVEVLREQSQTEDTRTRTDVWHGPWPWSSQAAQSVAEPSGDTTALSIGNLIDVIHEFVAFSECHCPWGENDGKCPFCQGTELMEMYATLPPSSSGLSVENKKAMSRFHSGSCPRLLWPHDQDCNCGLDTAITEALSQQAGHAASLEAQSRGRDIAARADLNRVGVAIDEQGVLVNARAEAAEARNKELEQERDEAKKLEQRFRTAYNSASERADSLSLLLREVGDKVTSWKKFTSGEDQGYVDDTALVEWLDKEFAALLTRLSSDTKEEK